MTWPTFNVHTMPALDAASNRRYMWARTEIVLCWGSVRLEIAWWHR
jgi:hypothetical protein